MPRLNKSIKMSGEGDFSLEWEERAETTPFKVHMVAGSLAGLTEHLLLLPIDNIKTHVQTTSANNLAALREISCKGLPSFYSGAGVVTLGCMPSHALFFLNYEFIKKRFAIGEELDLVRNMLLGATSALCHDVIMTPCDMVKQRRQLTNAPYPVIVKSAFVGEGVRSFWRSLPLNFFTNIPVAVATVTSNENLKVLHRRYIGELTPASYFACAAMAGAFAACVTTPLDNIRTRLNTQIFHTQNLQVIRDAIRKIATPTPPRSYSLPHIQRVYTQAKPQQPAMCDCNPFAPQNHGPAPLKYPNAVCAVRIILREEGRSGFLKGIFPRMSYQSLSSGVSWMCYEMLKNRLMGVKALH